MTALLFAVKGELLEAVMGNQSSYDKTVKEYCGMHSKPRRTYVIAKYVKPPYKGTWWVGEGIFGLPRGSGNSCRFLFLMLTS